MDPHYKKHIFICTNLKADGKTCCGNADAEVVKNYLKDELIKKKLHGPNKFRVSGSGCLGRCKKGPCLVVYPEGQWYSYKKLEDIDAIIEHHLINGEKVDELEINS